MKKIVITILVAALILFGASWALQGTASRNAQEAHLWLMQTLLPGSESFVVVPYDGEDANIQSIHKADNGFIIETLSYGYADNIRMLIGVSKEGTVTGLVVREAHETFGLGNKILTDTDFLAQFLNGSGSFEIATHGITGATVSSKAVARSVNSAVAYVTGADVASSATTWGG